MRSLVSERSEEETFGEGEYERTVDGEKDSLFIDRESEGRICRGEPDTEPDEPGLEGTELSAVFLTGATDG